MSTLLAVSLCLGPLAGASPVPAPQAPALEVDRERGEVRFPCRFVNPSRLLEVFACHNTGPAHETVVEFDASGPALVRALLEIGARNAAYWNATGPGDFERNQGDRILVLVRWEHAGERHERPAEGLLTDGQTEHPMPVRGFSFGARGSFRVEAPPGEEGDPGPAVEAEGAEGRAPGREEEDEEVRASRETGVPRVVEISLGATVRQRPSHPLLTHPTSSRRLQPWMLAPYLDLRTVPHHRELVEKAVPATLILRRVRSEETLVEVARAEALRRGLEAQELYASVLPIAREIDELKGRYEALIQEGRKLLERGKDPASLPDEAKQDAARAARELFARGQWLCARIEERYLSWYRLEEEHKTAWIQARDGLALEVRQEAAVLFQDGFRFEPEMAKWEVEAAALDLPGAPGLPAERGLRQQMARREIAILSLDRDAAICRANLEQARERAKGLDERGDAYVLRLFREEAVRWDIEARRQTARRDLERSGLDELRGLLDGTWEARQEEALRGRRRLEKLLEVVGLEAQLLEAREEIRWSENDLGARDVPERQRGAEERLAAARRKEAELLEQIEKLRRALDAPPAR